MYSKLLNNLQDLQKQINEAYDTVALFRRQGLAMSQISGMGVQLTSIINNMKAQNDNTNEIDPRQISFDFSDAAEAPENAGHPEPAEPASS